MIANKCLTQTVILFAMNTRLAFLVPFIALSTHTCFAADNDKPSVPPADVPASAKEKSVKLRMRFVPGGPPAKGSSDFEGAAFTDLGPGPEKGVLWCQAHAGVGDEFPVIDKQGVKLFDVRLAEGDDDHVVLEIRSKEGAKKIDLARDKRGSVKVAGIEYELLYPSVSVAGTPDEMPTTNKAMLMVTCRL
jgi:hypothetical protein